MTGDVFAQQIKVWNRGKRPIKSADILSPVFIEVGPSAKLLEARITNQARDVSDCKLSFEEPGTRSTSLSTVRIITNKIYFQCKILETGDGATIQIIYEGPREISLKFMGAIEGQRAILLENSLVRQPKSNPRIGSGEGYVWMVVLLFTVLLFILGILPREGVLGKLKKAIFVFSLAIPFVLGLTPSTIFYLRHPRRHPSKQTHNMHATSRPHPVQIASLSAPTIADVLNALCFAYAHVKFETLASAGVLEHFCF